MNDFFNEKCVHIAEFLKGEEIVWRTAVSNEASLMATLALAPFKWDSYRVLRLPLDEFLGMGQTVH